MVRPRQPSEVSDAVEQFLGVFKQPITKASEFYTYYWLTEVQGENEFDFDAFQTTATQSDAFLNYTIYAVARELENIHEKYEAEGTRIVKGIRPEKAMRPIPSEEERELIQSEVRLDIHSSVSEPNQNKAKTIVFDMNLSRRQIKEDQNVYSIAEKWEQAVSAYTEPDSFLRTARDIFKMGTKRQVASGWREAFGGDPWASVCESALQHSELSRTAYTDLMWSVEHNNGNFVNKVVPKVGQEYDSLIAGEMVSSRMRSRSQNGLFNHFLPQLLDSVREGDMEPVIKITSEQDRNVSSWARRNEDKWKQDD